MATDSTGFDPAELRKFSESGRVIAAAIGTSVEVWARAEAGVILKTWAGRTKVATAKALDRSGLMRTNRQARRAAGYFSYKGHVEPGEASVNLGLRGAYGRVWYRVNSLTPGKPRFILAYGNNFIPTRRHIPAADYPAVQHLAQRFQEMVGPIITAAKKSAGLSRQSIIQIADDLGIRLETVKGGGTLSGAGIAKARAALAQNGRAYQNGTGTSEKLGEQFSLTLLNRYPKIGPVGLDKTFRWVISGRVKYFEKNLAEGTFLAASRAARAYPYIEVLRTAA